MTREQLHKIKIVAKHGIAPCGITKRRPWHLLLMIFHYADDIISDFSDAISRFFTCVVCGEPVYSHAYVWSDGPAKGYSYSAWSGAHAFHLECLFSKRPSYQQDTVNEYVDRFYITMEYEKRELEEKNKGRKATYREIKAIRKEIKRVLKEGI